MDGRRSDDGGPDPEADGLGMVPGLEVRCKVKVEFLGFIQSLLEHGEFVPPPPRLINCMTIRSLVPGHGQDVSMRLQAKLKTGFRKSPPLLPPAVHH